MNIGGVDIPGRIFAAPMAGVTDKTFRAILGEFGVAVTYTEMVSAKGLIYGNSATQSLLGESPGMTNVRAAQIFGREPEYMARAAAWIAQNTDYQIIDINCGCPASKIVKSGEGSALMREPEKIGEIVRAVVRASNLPVTVKLRKGFFKNDSSAIRAAFIAWENGASAVCVHGRTREEMYGGEADWDIIREVKQNIGVPVIGNGDITSPERALAMFELTGCDAVMIGRGAWGNPWLIRRSNVYINTGCSLPEPTIAERVSMALRHMDMLAGDKGERAAVREMRRHLHMYIKGMRGASEARSRVNSAETVGGIRAALAIL